MLSAVRARLVLATLLTLTLVLAWRMRWGCDDAFISYIYARNLVYGDGLTWFGEAIEGYTNFAWVLWSALGFALGVEPLVWAWAGSLAALAIVMVVTYRVAMLRTPSPAVALFAVAMLATNYTFIAFGTSGLETMAQTALLTGAWYEVDRLRRAETTHPRRLAVLSVLAALALWTRLDSAVYLLVLGIAALHHLVRTRASAKHVLAAIVPATVLVGGWLAWKLVYYGDIFPNTFHAKVDVSTHTLWAATEFTGAFVHAYGLWIPLGLVAIVSIARRAFTPRLPLAIALAWIAYVIVVGGDFMEFRFFVPILPALSMLVAETLMTGTTTRPYLAPPVRALVLLALLVFFSRRHATTFLNSDDHFYDSVTQLGSYYGKVENNDWSKLGTHLGDVLADSGATLACNGAGAIPYYADLPTIDQLGLNDRWVARHGARPKPTYTRPAHQRFATHEYLAWRKVTFVIGSPALVPRGMLSNGRLTRPILYWVQRLLGPTPIRVNSVIAVAAPIDEEMALLLWYLTPTPEITERINRAGWETAQLSR